MQKFSSTLQRFDSDLWHFHFVVPKKVEASFDFKGARRVICKLNNTLDFPCALMPDGKGAFFINVNKEIRTKLNIEVGAKLSVELVEDKSKYGMPLAAEFEACLESDIEGSALFEVLTDGKKRTLIHVINKIKNPEIRIEKTLVILEHLKITNGVIDYVLLKEMMKRKG